MAPCCIEHDGYGASLDGRSKDGQRLLEIKSPVRGKESDLWAAARSGSVPLPIEVQIQHQLMTSSGAEGCDLVVYAAEIDKYEMVRNEPDPALQSQIRAAWDAFWPYYASQTPPEPCDRDHIERFDAEWMELEGRYLAAKTIMNNAEAEEVRLRKALLALAGDASCRGAALRLTRYWTRGAVDYGRIPELRGVDCEPYRKRGGYRFRLTEIQK